MALADWGKKLGDMAQNTVEKSKSLAEITKLNIANGNLQDEIRKISVTIGDYVIENNLLLEDARVSECITKINELKASVQANTDQIQAIKSQSTCGKCGASFSANSNFCEKCGEPKPMLETAASKVEPAAPAAEAEPVVCVSCGKLFEGDSIFCGECGTKRPE